MTNVQPSEFPETITRLRAQREAKVTPDADAIRRATAEAEREAVRRGDVLDKPIFDKGKADGRRWAAETGTLLQLERLRNLRGRDELENNLKRQDGDGRFVGNRLAVQIFNP